ncbi:hypothetical protein NDU88_010872 [Pleurodeles waltl]|uniref:Uncharacterized protein n=1 Tax=Pleurodeles waltl TaxID=8319 RepID=A0AAV7R016_PLEWA|nr:hypothetical protein NDU88_010872 [Pleurodeles waltl]
MFQGRRCLKRRRGGPLSPTGGPRGGGGDQAWDWVAEKQELRSATWGGEAGPEKKGPWRDSPPGMCAEEALPVAMGLVGGRVPAHDHLANDLQNEQVLDDDFVATSALFVSAESIPTF